MAGNKYIDYANARAIAWLKYRAIYWYRVMSWYQ